MAKAAAETQPSASPALAGREFSAKGVKLAVLPPAAAHLAARAGRVGRRAVQGARR